MNKQQIEGWISTWKSHMWNNANYLESENPMTREMWKHTLGYQYRMLATLVTDMNKGLIDPVNPVKFDDETYDILKRHGIIPENEPAVEKWLAR